MLKKSMSLNSLNKLMGLYILGFALIYGVLPSLCYQSILPDSAQNLTWGHSWLWSYNRHPPLGTWVISLMSMLFRNNEVATFSASVLCLSVSLWFVYLLSMRYLSAQTAFAASVLSSFSVYYLASFVLQFNQNTIMLPFWVMICYFLDSCLRANRFRDWVFLAVVTAGSLLAKYESLIIILLALVYLFCHFEKRYTSHLLRALLLTFTLLAPHLISVAQHGFLTVEFIHNRVEEGQNHAMLYTHLYYPIKALLEQLGHLLLSVLILALLIKMKRFIRVHNHGALYQFNYLVYFGISPLLLVILISSIWGLKIQPEWGFPLFSLTLPAICFFFQLEYRVIFLKPLLFLGLFIHFISLSGYMSVNYFSPKFARTSYPSYVLAQNAVSYWQQHTNQPIGYVAGDENVDYYLAAYLATKPLLLEAYSLKQSPWLDKEKLKKVGGLYIIEGCDPTKIMRLKKQYSVQDPQCIQLPLSNKYREQLKQFTLMILPGECDAKCGL